ncbi:His/Gly/Thr/Pro-type tRNA ligase C-terminal domain-containing protein, partial [Ralstonia solanacearum]
PACGWAMGVERIIELLREEKLAPEPQGCDVYIVHQGDQAQVQALVAAERLRDAGLDVILHCSPEGRNGSFKSQFKRADASGASYAVIIGDDEVAAGVAQIKPLRGEPSADTQQTVPSDQLVDRLIDAMVANSD